MLQLLGMGGIGSLGGCNRAGSDGQSTPSSVKRDRTPVDTVIFTSTRTTSQDSDTIVFDDGGREGFSEALETLAGNPGAELKIEPGTYRFDPPDALEPGAEYFQIQNPTDVTIDGQGARIVLTKPIHALWNFLGGKNVVVRNLTIDYDPPPFTQAEIIDLSDDKRVVTVEIEEGYPPLSHEMFEVSNGFRGVIHMQNGDIISGIPDKKEPVFDFSSIEHLDGRRFEVSQKTVDPEGLVVGRRLVAQARTAGCLVFINMSRPSVENVTIHTSPGMAVTMPMCDGATIRDVTIAPPSDSDRLLGSVADGIHVTDGRTGPIVENCHIEAIGDDGIVVDTFMLKVTDLIDERTVAVDGKALKSIQSGDNYEALSPAGVRKGPLSTVTDIKYHQSFDKPWVPAIPEALTFEDEVSSDIEPGDFLVNMEMTNPEFVVRNNLVRNSDANPLRLASGPGIVENNEFDGSALHGIWMRCDTGSKFIPARWTNDVIIRDNVITRSGFTTFAAPFSEGVRAIHWPDWGKVNEGTEGNPHRNIEVMDNVIETTAKASILLEDTKTVSIESNVMRHPNQIYEGKYGVGINNVIGAKVTGNTVSGSDEHLSEFGWKRGSEDVDSSDNELIINGESAPAELVSKTPDSNS